MKPTDLLRVNQFCEENKAFTQGSIRWLIHNSNNNGLENAKAIVRIGSSVYIHVPRFSEWLENGASL